MRNDTKCIQYGFRVSVVLGLCFELSYEEFRWLDEKKVIVLRFYIMFSHFSVNIYFFPFFPSRTFQGEIDIGFGPDFSFLAKLSESWFQVDHEELHGHTVLKTEEKWAFIFHVSRSFLWRNGFYYTQTSLTHEIKCKTTRPCSLFIMPQRYPTRNFITPIPNLSLKVTYFRISTDPGSRSPVLTSISTVGLSGLVWRMKGHYKSNTLGDQVFFMSWRQWSIPSFRSNSVKWWETFCHEGFYFFYAFHSPHQV